MAASHSRTVLSSAAGGDARAVGAERHTGHRVGVAGQRLRRPVGRWSASHSRTVLSSPPEAMRVPSGLNATLDTGDPASAILIRLTVLTSALTSGPSSGVCASRRAASSCW